MNTDMNMNTNMNTDMDISLQSKEFINIWNKYYTMIHVNEYDFRKYTIIIDKLRKEIELKTIDDKKTFIELIETMAYTIYTVENFAYKYGLSYYKQTKIYDEPELNYCSKLIFILENAIERELIDNYDIEFTNQFLEENK